MKHFLITGSISSTAQPDAALFEAHKRYTQAWMDAGHILLSTLYADYSGSAHIVCAESYEEVRRFYDQEPFARAGVQQYHIREIDIHFSQMPTIGSKAAE